MYSKDSTFLQNSSSRSQSSIVQNLLESFHKEYMEDEQYSQATPSSTTNKTNETTTNLLNFSHKLEMKKAKHEFSDEKRLFEKREKDLEDRNTSLISTISELEEKNNKLKKENQDILKKSFKLNESTVEESNKKDVIIEKLKREIFQIENSKEAAIADLQSKLTKEENTRRGLSDNRDFLKSELMLMNLKYQEEINKKHIETEEKMSGMRCENDELKNNLSIAEKIIKDLNSKLEDVKQTQHMLDAFHENRKNLSNLEEVNKKLHEKLSAIKERNENIFLLKERNNALESQLERFRSKCKDYDKLKSENEIINKQVKQLQANHNNRATADVLKVEVTRLDSEKRELLKTYSKMRHHLSSSEEEKKRLQDEVTSLKAQIRTNTEDFQSLEKSYLECKMRLKITCDERDSLHNLLKTYEVDATSTNQLQRRCKSLHDTNVELQKKLEEAYKMHTSEASKTQKSCTSCISLQEEKERLLQEFEKLKNKFENKYGGGYNPDSTQVLHFCMNPVDVAKESHKKQLEEIQLENKRLKHKLKEMQTGHEVSMSEIEFGQRAKKQIELAHLREEQLRETYSKIIEQLRQIDPDGEVNLLESNFSKQVTSLIDLHLHHQKSFPMFISAVTQELFSDQTILN